MFPKASLVLAAALAAVSALPTEPRDTTIVLPVTKHSSVTSVSNLVARGQAKINLINGETKIGNVDASSGPATNEDVSYIAGVTIGSTSYSLIVDTGCELLV